MTKPSTIETLSRLKRSREDEDAWRMLYLRLWPFVVSVNYHFLGGARNLVEDASQEVLVRLVQYCDFTMFNESSAFFAYVRVVCMNVSRDLLSEVAKRGESNFSDSLKNLPQFATGGLNSQVKKLEAKDALRSMLGRLKPDEQQLLRCVILGYSLQEISNLLGMTYTNTGVRMHRLRKKLERMVDIPDKSKSRIE